MPVRLPILELRVRDQRYSCHGCGNCCRDFTVQLREDDLRKLREQKWEERLGEAVTVRYRGVEYLKQREDGSCMFLMENGLCRIHAEFRFEEKPIACQLFPFTLIPGERGAQMGINFACQSVLENKGAELRTHAHDLKRMQKSIPEAQRDAPPPLLKGTLRASKREAKALIERLDVWLRPDRLPLPTRLDGLAWLASMLDRAMLDDMRDKRFTELLDTLFAALPGELLIEELPPSTHRQRRLLRQAVFARVEDPKLGRIAKYGRIRSALEQFARSHRFSSGKGVAPHIGEEWPARIELSDVEHVRGARTASQIHAINDLITRWLRASILGGRSWGPGYYGWPIVFGLRGLVLNAASVAWLARLHAAGHDRNAIEIEDVRAALGRVDRTAGRAKWIGTRAEKLRVSYLAREDGLRRLLSCYPLIDPESQEA